MISSARIEEIFNKYRNNIYRLALSIVRNEKDAEDILQNTLVKIIRKLDTFRNRSKISTWIYKVTYNESLMYLRKKYRQNRLTGYLSKPQTKEMSGLFVNWSKLPDEELLETEFKGRMENTINNMPIKYRMPMLLHHTEKLDLKDSADILRLKLNSLKTRLHRAYMIMRSEMEDYYKDRQEHSYKRDKKCGIWTNFIYDYAQGRLGKNRQQSFKRHISDCSPCRGFLKQYARAIGITRALQCQDLPEELREKILSFVLKKGRKH